MTELTLEKKVGRLLVVGFPGKSITPEIQDFIHTYHICGIILFSHNIGTPEEVLDLTTALQKEAKSAGYTRPLLICIDQENGVVRRLGDGTTIFPGAMALGATNDQQALYDIGFATAKELKALGINWNLAPVVDVNSNPENPVIGVRSFGESAINVSSMASASMKGMQAAGIATALKHFPGHGDTATDSHLALPAISHDVNRLEEVELQPYKRCIAEGADAVLMSHIYFPAIDAEPDTPATTSRNIITGLLREHLNFSGVITTDCMEMDAIKDTIGTDVGVLKSLQAGVDLALVSHTYTNQQAALALVLNALKNNELDESEVDASIARTDVMIDRYTTWADVMTLDEIDLSEAIGTTANRKLAYQTYKNSVTIVHNNNLLPLSMESAGKVLVLEPAGTIMTKAEDQHYARKGLGAAVQHYYPQADIKSLDLQQHEATEAIVGKVSMYDYVIIGTINIGPDSAYSDFIDKLHQKNDKIIGIAMRNPYDAFYLKNASAFINTYEPTYTALEIAAGAIFGKVQVAGRLPVQTF